MPYLTPPSVPIDFVCRTLRIPNSPYWLSIVSGALLELTRQYNWEVDGVSVSEAILAAMEIFDSYMESSACMIGACVPYASASPPENTLPCDGATYNRVDYPVLYDSLDTVYLIDASTFRVPDLRGRSVVGNGQGTSLSNRLVGQSFGTETHQLSSSEMPSHAHQYAFAAVPVPVAPGAVPVQPPDSGLNATTVVGGNVAHNNVQPSHVLRYCIVAR